MSDIDLTEAKAVAYRVYCEAQHRGPMGDADFEAARSRVEEAWMSTALAASASLIEAAVREQIAGEIESRVPATHPARPYCDGLNYAARIARGES